VSEYRRIARDAPARSELSAAAVRLVVVEDGSDPLEHATSDAGDQTLVIAQTGGERPLDFAKRAIRRIWGLEPRQRIVHVSLLLAPRFDVEATEGRVCLVRALLAHATAVPLGASELLLSAGSDLHADLRSKVLAAVDALRQEPNGTSLPINVQFGTDCAQFRQQPGERLPTA
jgi:hypothetical protein